MGRAAAFSFYPGKNLGACGEAGAVTTNDAGIADKIKMLRDHGQAKKYYHDVEGYNGRLDAIQAGLLHAKLAHLANWNTQRRDRAAEYNRLLAGNEVLSLPYEPSWSRAVYHLYVIRTERPRRHDEPPEKGWHRHGNSLPDSASYAESLCLAELQSGRLPRGRDELPPKSSPCQCSRS